VRLVQLVPQLEITQEPLCVRLVLLESFQIAQDLPFVQFAQLVHQLLTSPALTAVLFVDPAATAAMMDQQSVRSVQEENTPTITVPLPAACAQPVTTPTRTPPCVPCACQDSSVTPQGPRSVLNVLPGPLLNPSEDQLTAPSALPVTLPHVLDLPHVIPVL